MSVRDSFHLSFKNWIPDLTIASTVAAESAYPLTNMQNSTANDWTVIDTTGETSVVLTWSSATAMITTCLGIHNHNLPDGTTVLLELFDGETQTGTELYNSTALDVMHNVPIGALLAGYDPIEGNFEDESSLKTHFSIWFDTVSPKSGRLTITNASGFTDDALRIDKLWLGPAYCPTDGPERGYGSTLIDDSEHQRKPGGGMETVQGVVRRSLNLVFKMVSNAERQTLRYMLDRVKKSGDFMMTMDPNDAQSMNYETTSIYRRTNDISFMNSFYNGNEFGLAAEEN